MEDISRKQLSEVNLKNYKSAMDRIIGKYSKLQYQDGGMEVNLDNLNTKTLDDYMRLSKINLKKLEPKSLTDLREESLRAQDITGDSRLDLTCQDSGADQTSDSSSQFSVEDVGVTRSDVTQLTVSSLDESQRNVSDVELQPEDQDEELQMSLNSHGSSLLELYPSMISRIERAWHRQHVTTAADSVLRRYRRWRQLPNRSNLNTTFVVSLKHTRGNPKKTTSKAPFRESSCSPVKRPFTTTDTTPQSALGVITSMHDWRAQQRSPDKQRGTLRNEQHQPVLAMDIIAMSEEISNKTFTVREPSPPELSQLEEQVSTYTVSPSLSCYPTAKPCVDPSFIRRSLTAHAEQAAGCSAHSSESSAVKERPDIYGSPVRQSPLKARMMASINRSPHAFSRSPKTSVERSSREPMRPRSLSASLSSPLQKPVVPLMMLYRQDTHQSLQPQLRSPQSATAADCRHRLRRHLSFDSSQPSIPVSYSPKKVDENFLRLYHKFVCQSKSALFNSRPCRLCARGSEANRGHSSSVLAALALSPHRSVLRKRHRELDWDSHPQSKRFREEYCTYSPGSKWHRKEMLRLCLSPSEQELPHGGLSHNSSKHNMFPRFSAQQPRACQEACMIPRRPSSAADFSGLGGSLESKMANGYSPRKWW